MEGRPSRPPDATPATLRGRASQDNVAPMVDADVVIVGGGIAGSATALRLARAGIDVVVIERATFPRDKPCGEGLLPHGIEVLAELGCADILDTIEAQPFRGILYRCHGVVARGDFDDDARGRGVRRYHL